MVAAGVTRWRTAGVTLTEELETRALEAVKLCIELGIDVNAADLLTDYKGHRLRLTFLVTNLG